MNKSFAARYFQLSAEQGNEDALTALCTLLSNEDGILMHK
jgi:TPR repeat protein